jgi:hypothetical protein
VTISIAITRVYATMAVWMPVTVVPRSFATVAIDTFITELSSAIRNWPAHSVSSTAPPAGDADPSVATARASSTVSLTVAPSSNRVPSASLRGVEVARLPRTR